VHKKNYQNHAFFPAVRVALPFNNRQNKKYN